MVQVILNGNNMGVVSQQQAKTIVNTMAETRVRLVSQTETTINFEG